MTDALNILPALRTAIIGYAPIASQLSVWESEPAVFTRRPTPENADYPMCVLSGPVSVGDADMLKARIPLPRYDVLFYGRQPEDYRVVEDMGFLARRFFHRNRFSIDLAPDYSVIQVVATGPMIAPVDDQRLLGRAVLLQFKLEDLTTA